MGRPLWLIGSHREASFSRGSILSLSIRVLFFFEYLINDSFKPLLYLFNESAPSVEDAFFRPHHIGQNGIPCTGIFKEEALACRAFY